LTNHVGENQQARVRRLRPSLLGVAGLDESRPLENSNAEQNTRQQGASQEPKANRIESVQ
jgi:hypothetical protein